MKVLNLLPLSTMSKIVVGCSVLSPIHTLKLSTNSLYETIRHDNCLIYVRRKKVNDPGVIIR